MTVTINEQANKTAEISTLSKQMRPFMLLDTAPVMLSHYSGAPAKSLVNAMMGADPTTTCNQMDKQPPPVYVALV